MHTRTAMLAMLALSVSATTEEQCEEAFVDPAISLLQRKARLQRVLAGQSEPAASKGTNDGSSVEPHRALSMSMASGAQTSNYIFVEVSKIIPGRYIEWNGFGIGEEAWKKDHDWTGTLSEPVHVDAVLVQSDWTSKRPDHLVLSSGGKMLCAWKHAPKCSSSNQMEVCAENRTQAVRHLEEGKTQLEPCDKPQSRSYSWCELPTPVAASEFTLTARAPHCGFFGIVMSGVWAYKKTVREVAKIIPARYIQRIAIGEEAFKKDQEWTNTLSEPVHVDAVLVQSAWHSKRPDHLVLSSAGVVLCEWRHAPKCSFAGGIEVCAESRAEAVSLLAGGETELKPCDTIQSPSYSYCKLPNPITAKEFTLTAKAPHCGVIGIVMDGVWAYMG